MCRLQSMAGCQSVVPMRHSCFGLEQALYVGLCPEIYAVLRRSPN